MKKGKERDSYSQVLEQKRAELEAAGTQIVYMDMKQLNQVFGVDLNALSYDQLMVIFNPEKDENKIMSVRPKVTAFLRKKRKDDMRLFPEKYEKGQTSVIEGGVVRFGNKEE